MPGEPRETWSGLLRVDKPTGVTSHDVVDLVRRRLRVKSAGHLGTLDPGASGLLVLVLGAATRCAQVWQTGLKTYEATVRFGVVTSTQDLQGEVLERREVMLDEWQVREAAAAFDGRDRAGASHGLGAQGERSAPAPAGAARRGGRARSAARHGPLLGVDRLRAARSELPRGRLGGHLRPHAGARPRRAPWPRGRPEEPAAAAQRALRPRGRRRAARPRFVHAGRGARARGCAAGRSAARAADRGPGCGGGCGVGFRPPAHRGAGDSAPARGPALRGLLRPRRGTARPRRARASPRAARRWRWPVPHVVFPWAVRQGRP